MIKSSTFGRASVASMLAISAVMTAGHVAAQAWPTKPVRIVIAFAPGGGTDIMGRMLARKFADATGQSFVPENRAGAGGLLAAEFVSKAPPDGHTVMVSTASLSVNVNQVALLRKLWTDFPEKREAMANALASRGTSRCYVARSSAALFRDQPEDFAVRHSRALVDDWFVDTNLNKARIRTLSIVAVQAAGLKWNVDVKVYWRATLLTS